jgi:hypothetical protein
VSAAGKIPGVEFNKNIRLWIEQGTSVHLKAVDANDPVELTSNEARSLAAELMQMANSIDSESDSQPRIDFNQLIPLLVEAYPGVRDHLVKTVDDWLGNDGAIKPCMLLAAVGWLVSERIGRGEYEGADRLFGLIERLLTEGTSAVRDAAATCFLENLINRSDSLDPRLYAPLMGQESRKYCRAWDDFTGVKTPGLYGDDDR